MRASGADTALDPCRANLLRKSMFTFALVTAVFSRMCFDRVVVAPQPARIFSNIVRSPLPRAIAPKELVLYGLRLGVELLHIM